MDPETVDIAAICGTAFFVAEDIFVTAAHVAAMLEDYDDAALGYEREWRIQHSPIQDRSQVARYDLAFLRCSIARARPLKWSTTELPLLADVQTLGFPYGFDSDEYMVSLRGFKGYVVSTGLFCQLASRPHQYEVSFSAPRGLSGAPLLTVSPDPKVKGIVIGNQSMEMPVFRSRESVDGLLVERYEAMQTGIALQASALLDAESPLFPGTFGEFLARSGLLDDETA